MKLNTKILFIMIATAASILVFGLVLWHTVLYASSDEIILPNLVKHSVTATKPEGIYPQRLRVPSIGLNTNVQLVGITKKGNMATPNNFTDVGWFKYGTIPGDKGSAIIAGHVDNGLALPAVFSNLHNLKKGDDIYVDTEDGRTIHFVVTDMQTYDYNAPTEKIFNQNDASYLKLITCAGVWVPAYGTHDKRLIVTAKKV